MSQAEQLLHHLFDMGMAELKYETARELGLMDVIVRAGWAGVSAKECGRVGGTIAAWQGDRFVRQLVQLAMKEEAAVPRHLPIRRRFIPTRRSGRT